MKGQRESRKFIGNTATAGVTTMPKRPHKYERMESGRMTFAFLIIFQSAKPTSPPMGFLVDEPNWKQRTLGIVVCSTQPSAIQKGKKWI